MTTVIIHVFITYLDRDKNTYLAQESLGTERRHLGHDDDDSPYSIHSFSSTDNEFNREETRRAHTFVILDRSIQTCHGGA
jgi:hypothetical protein